MYCVWFVIRLYNHDSNGYVIAMRSNACIHQYQHRSVLECSRLSISLRMCHVMLPVLECSRLSVSPSICRVVFTNIREVREDDRLNLDHSYGKLHDRCSSRRFGDKQWESSHQAHRRLTRIRAPSQTARSPEWLWYDHHTPLACAVTAHTGSYNTHHHTICNTTV